LRRLLSILVIDGDPSSRAQALRGLENLGFQATGCPDGREALSLCFGGAFDAVIVDVGVLAAGGMRMTQSLREQVSYKSLPIIGVAKPGAPTLPMGSGLDILVEAQAAACALSHALHCIRAIHGIRQQRGFLAVPDRLAAIRQLP